MSDEEGLVIYPAPSEEWLANHRRELVSEMDAIDRENSAKLTSDALLPLQRMAEERIRIMTALPCEGSVSYVSKCSDAFANTCSERSHNGCPRNIIAFDKAVELANANERLKASGCPQDAIDSLSGDITLTGSMDAVNAFLCDPEKRLLILSGNAGVGKTVAAAYAIKRQPGRFVTCAEFRRLSSFREDAQEHLAKITKTPLLVIDDLGTEHGSEFFQSMIEPLIVSRHDNTLKTIITCNVDAKSFRTRYGERIADRIIGRGTFVHVGGSSMRGAK